MFEIATSPVKDYYQFSIFQNFGLVCAFSSRRLSNMSLYYGDTNKALDNRKKFLNELGISQNLLVCAKQVHGKNIRYVTSEDKGKGALSYTASIPDTDGFVTKDRGIPLAIFTADCLSIFLYDSQIKAIGIIHAGWRGTKENITVSAIRLMREQFGSRPVNIYVGFGPAIRDCCYEVEEGFLNIFSSGILRKHNRCYLDLVGLNTEQLLQEGIRRNNILDSGICTSCDNRAFFSYRKESNNCGRIMSVIMLK